MGESRYLSLLRERILVVDGAMGTNLQARGLTAEDFGGPGLEGCNDHLVLSRPDVVEQVHSAFLDVGVDVVETDSFRANALTLREYGLQDRVVEINQAAAALARRVADRYSTDERPRFVAGSMGPSGFLPSSSDPTLGAITYDELADVFAEQARGLVEGGADVLLLETSQDMLEVKAQIAGIRRYFRRAGRRLPIQAQVTLDTSGRMLLGTDIAAAMVVLEALRVDIIGLNCSTGPEHMRQPVRWLSENCRLPISVIPNAGIPHNEGGTACYPLSPAELADAHDEFTAELGVSIVGGCCGTTPEHLRAVVERVWGRRPRSREVARLPRVASAMTATNLRQDPPPALIGERVNAQGSRAVKRLLLADDYDGILSIARGQVEGGAHLLDVCVALTERQDEAEQMRRTVRLLAQGVEAPLQIDSTDAAVVRAALEQYPGRAVINSINLENGRGRVDEVLPYAVEHGAAVVALTIDEEGMARTAGRKLEIARRIRDIAVGEYGLEPRDLIFDVLTFTLATGDAALRRSALETIEGIRLIRRELPGVLTSLGVSNVSFGLQRQARAVLNSVFLHHCVQAGLDLAIVNPAHITPYAEIPAEERALADALIFDRAEDALARFIACFQSSAVEEEAAVDPIASLTPDRAIQWMILHRRKEGVEELVDQAIRRRQRLGVTDPAAEPGGSARLSPAALSAAEDPDPDSLSSSDHLSTDAAAVYTLNRVLLPAMKEVGDRFGAGELILPFVLQSAEVMKKAVARLETYLDRKDGRGKGTVVLATVYGDVHDIGKSLVATILANNGYTVHDLGKQVPVDTIVERATALGADAIGLSALLVSTSKQMPLCVRELQRRGSTIPVLIGGAAINPSFARAASFVDAERGELYAPGVFYCKDAFAGLTTMDALMDPARRDSLLAERAREVRRGVARRAELQARAPAGRAGRAGAPAPEPDIPRPPFWGVAVLERIPLAEVYDLIELNTLYRLHWGARNAEGEKLERLVREEFEPRLRRYRHEVQAGGWAPLRAAYGYFPAAAEGDAVVVYDPADPARDLARFHFPRQAGRDGLCLSDYFAPAAGDGPRDVLPLQIVTLGDGLLERSRALMQGGDYGEGYFLHGFGVRLAEAGAEWLHRHIRRELALSADCGLRYSWGYPACPDHRQHHLLFSLLPARERLGMEVTEAGALVPELSTAALVVHHPEAKYFSL